MKQSSTHSKPEKGSNQLPYNPDKDELQGVEEYRDVFNLLDQGMHSVNEQVVHSIVNFASTYPNNGR